jgi:hypothetical protein
VVLLRPKQIKSSFIAKHRISITVNAGIFGAAEVCS